MPNWKPTCHDSPQGRTNGRTQHRQQGTPRSAVHRADREALHPPPGPDATQERRESPYVRGSPPSTRRRPEPLPSQRRRPARQGRRHVPRSPCGSGARRPAGNERHPQAGRVDAYLLRREDIKPSTRINLENAKRYAVAYFGEAKRLDAITEADAEDDRRHLEKTLSANTCKAMRRQAPPGPPLRRQENACSRPTRWENSGT